jgi:uncharacterized protein
MQPKTERFEMRLDQATIVRVDEWRSHQDDLPSRAEAIRRLVEAGLAQSSDDKVIRLSDGEKLLLMMLTGLYKHLKVKGDIDPEFVEAAIHGGHLWGLEWQYPGIFHGHDDSNRTLRETLEVLDMWSFLENGYARLSQEEKAHIEKEVGPLGKSVEFRGFDGNNEAEYMGIAYFLVNKLERFSLFKGRDLNAHSPTIDAYHRMLSVFVPMRSKLTGGELNASQIIEILKERIHPENRK